MSAMHTVSPARPLYHRPLRLGTRGSALARIQAALVSEALLAAWPDMPAPETVVIRTSGDRIQDRSLAEIGGKGLFTKEIEAALLAGDIDLAVHSMKDVQTELTDRLVIDCILPRGDVRDAFFARRGGGLEDLPGGATVGTSSLRRGAQILARRPDVRIVPLRGNVDTRLSRLAAGDMDATLLAVAGLRRLGVATASCRILAPETMLPAVAQGAIGLERRAADDRIARIVAPLHHRASADRIAAERALLAGLNGSCRSPVAGLATRDSGSGLRLRGLVARPDGSGLRMAEARGDDPVALGRGLAETLRRAADPDILAADRGLLAGGRDRPTGP